jgi:hypothetical protein
MPLMEAFEKDEGHSRYIFVPKPGKHGHVLDAVSVNDDGTTRYEVKARSKAELAKKAALLEKALGKTTKQNTTQADGSFACAFTAMTQLKSLSTLVPKGDLAAATVEAIRRGLISAPTAKKAAKSRVARVPLSITVETITDSLPA